MAAFALFAALQGVRRGLGPALLGVVAVPAAYLAASVWYRPVAAAIRAYLPLSESWAATVAFILLLLAAVELVSLILALRTSADHVPAPSRALGLAVGAVRGMTLATALLVAQEDVEHHRRAAMGAQGREPVHAEIDRVVADPFDGDLDDP